ncbi:MAG: nucleotidyltransferase family protein [Bacteroidales bacterium]|jgi:molybdenum cofactor cytidylyltransferase
MAVFSEIWAVVLAAGESSRMKTPKLILPFRGRTIIENVILNILDSDVKNVIVVTGAWEKEVIAAISDLPVKTCTNVNYRSGMLSSVICGLNSLPPGTAAAIVFQGDQPEIAAEVIDLLTATWRKERKGIIVPIHNGKRGHPLLISEKYFSEVALLDAGTGLRGLLSECSHDILEVEVENRMILRDIDTNEDYLESINIKH